LCFKESDFLNFFIILYPVCFTAQKTITFKYFSSILSLVGLGLANGLTEESPPTEAFDSGSTLGLRWSSCSRKRDSEMNGNHSETRPPVDYGMMGKKLLATKAS